MRGLATRCQFALDATFCFLGKLGITKHHLQKLLVPILARPPPRTPPLEVRAAHERRRRRPRDAAVDASLARSQNRRQRD